MSFCAPWSRLLSTFYFLLFTFYFLLSTFYFQKFPRRERPRREARQADRAFEIVSAIDAGADGRGAFALRLECNLRFGLQHAVDIAAEHLAVIGHGDVIPLPHRMQLVFDHQRPVVARTVDERVEIPVIVDSAQLEEEP